MQILAKRRFKQRRLLRNHSHTEAEDVARKRNELVHLTTEPTVHLRFRRSQHITPTKISMQLRHSTIFQEVSVSKYLQYYPGRMAPTFESRNLKRKVLEKHSPPKSPVYKQPRSFTSKPTLTISTMDKEKNMPLAAQFLQRLIVKNYHKYSSRGAQSIRQSSFRRYPQTTTKETIARLMD